MCVPSSIAFRQLLFLVFCVDEFCFTFLALCFTSCQNASHSWQSASHPVRMLHILGILLHILSLLTRRPENVKHSASHPVSPDETTWRLGLSRVWYGCAGGSVCNIQNGQQMTGLIIRRVATLRRVKLIRLHFTPVVFLVAE